MVYVRSRKFLCCIPVRIGVLLMTLVGAFGGGAIAVSLWIDISKNGTFDTGSSRDKIVAGVNAGVWTLLALVSFFGLIGAIAKRAGLVSLYATLLFINLFLSVATGGFYLYTLFQADTKQRAVDKCFNNDTSEFKTVKKDACTAAYDVARIVIIPVFVFVWLFLLYGCTIVSNYVGQLHEEHQLEDLYTAASRPKVVPAYPMQPIPEGQPLTSHDHNEYPYNSAQHSFGYKA